MLFQDLRYGLRMLRRQPLFAVTAVLTLALAMGATGAIFTLLDAVVLHPWPFPHPEQLVLVIGKDNQGNEMPISMPDLADYRAAHSLSAIAAGQSESVSLTRTGEPARLDGAFVSSEFFPLFDVRPLLGRVFRPEDDRPGAARVCLLAESVWRSRFGADPHLLGRALTLNGQLATVIGIIPSTFQQPLGESEIWLPIQAYSDYSYDRIRPVGIGFARIATDATLVSSRAEMNLIATRLARAYPAADANRGVLIVPMRELVNSAATRALQLLSAAVLSILLIAAANIAGLLAARAWSRRQEMAVRVALGAGSWRIVRQMLTESLLLSMLGGTVGVMLAWFGSRIPLTAFGSISGPSTIATSTLVLIVAAVSVSTGLLFGIIPALLARRAGDSLRVRGVSAGQSRFRSALIVVQVAIAMVLLSAAGLTARSLYQLMRVDPGIRPERLLSLEYRLPSNKYRTGAEQTAFHNLAVERVAAVPGVEAVGIVRSMSFSGNTETVEIGFPDRPAAPAGSPWMSRYNAVTPTYFSTVGIALLHGREIQPSDGPGAARVVVVSRSFAQKFFPGHSPLGREVLIPESDAYSAAVSTKMIPATIVGIVGDVKQVAINEPTRPQLYVPYAQDPFTFANLVVRTHGDPLALTKAIQRAIWSVDPDQPIWKIRTVQSLIDTSVRGGSRGMLAIALMSFAGFALLLAGIGLYGVLAYTVGQRAAEFGVRMAIGASPSQIMGLIIGRGLALAGVGVLIGIAAALGLNRFLRSELYQVRTTDPDVYAAITIVLLLIALLAVAVPARRAMSIHPAHALRHE